MGKLNKQSIIFLLLVSLVLAIFLAPAVFLLFMGMASSITKHYSPLLFIDAIKANYGLIYFGAYMLCVAVIFATPLIVMYLPKTQKQFGDAKFADVNEVRKNELFGDSEGIIIGKFKGNLLRFGGQQFVALGAPTRSGKGVGIVIPNLLSYRNSAVVQDIKQECFDYTSLYREKVMGQKVFLFDPFSRRTHRYNPLGYIDLDSSEMDSQLVDFGNIMYSIEGDPNTAFFNSLAQSLFIGLCLMYRDLTRNEEAKAFLIKNNINLEFTLYGILSMSEGFRFVPGLKAGSNRLESEFDVFRRAKEIKDGEDKIQEGSEVSGFPDTYMFCDAMGWLTHKTQERLQTYFNIDSDNTRSGVMSSFNAPLLQYKADNMRFATSPGDAGPMGDFNFADLRKQKMTIYVGITPDQLANAKAILNLFWQQLILVNTKELPQTHPELKYPVMLLMDEFTASGYLPTYQKGISFIAGYWLRSVMIYQSQSQLEDRPPIGYGKEGAATLLTNHACQIYYTPREQADAEKLSKLLGDKTIKTRNRSYGNKDGRVTGTENETKRALMLPQEVKELPGTEEIIFIEKVRPIKANKAFYYNDPYFYSRFVEVSPSLQKFYGLSEEDVTDSFPVKYLDDKFLKREEISVNENNKTITSPNEIRTVLEKRSKDKEKGSKVGKMFKTVRAMRKGKIISYERCFYINKPLPQNVMESAITKGETRIKVPFQSIHKNKIEKLCEKMVSVASLCYIEYLLKDRDVA